MFFSSHYLSPLGDILLTSDGRALTGLWFYGQKHFPPTFANEILPSSELPVFSETRRWLDLYFAGKCPDFTPPLAPVGTPFRQKAWATLLDIPYGKTTTYKEIAGRIGCRSFQAVGGAVGHNPISIIVPCHRVLGADGALTGYAGGLEKKEWMLRMERGR